MVWRSSPGRDQIVPHAHWEWQIGELAAVEMPDLVVVDLEFNPSKAVRLRRDGRPAQQLTLDCVSDRHFVTSLISRASEQYNRDCPPSPQTYGRTGTDRSIISRV